MTIAEVASIVTYTGNGVTTSFPTTFKFENGDDLVCTLITIATGTRLVMDPSLYTVSGAGDDGGGTVETLGVLVSSQQIEIARNTQQLQPVDLAHNDGADAETMEDALDRLTMMVQDLDRRISSLVIGGTGLSVANEVDDSGQNNVPLFSRVVSGEHLIRRFAWTGGINMDAAATHTMIGLTGFFGAWYEGISSSYDETNSAWNASIQTMRPAPGAAIVMAAEGAAVDEGKWAFYHPSDDVLSIATSDDTMDNFSEFLQFTRSGATAVSTKLAVLLDANAKRIGNVGTMDFDETAKGTTSGAITFDFSAANCYSITLNGAVTATFTAPAGATTTYIEATQDGTGSRVFTFPAAVKWTAATVAGDKLLSTGASKRDLIVLKWNAAGTAALAQIFKDW